MYRPARFVSSVRVVTFKDVNVEELPEKELADGPRSGPVSPRRPPTPAGKQGESPRARCGGRGRGRALVLEAGGYAILDRNWRVRSGELDIVATRGRVVVFCEVKNAFLRPVRRPERGNHDKRARLRGLAAQWLAAHPESSGQVRFDVASVLQGPRGAPTIDVLEAAF